MLRPPVRGIGRGSTFAVVAPAYVRTFRTWYPLANDDPKSPPGDKRPRRARNVPSLDPFDLSGGQNGPDTLVNRVRDIKSRDAGRGTLITDSSTPPKTSPSRGGHKVHNIDNLSIRGGGILMDALNQVEGVEQNWKLANKTANLEKRRKERSDKARSYQREMDAAAGKRREQERAAAEGRGKAIFAERKGRRRDGYTAAPNRLARGRGKDIASLGSEAAASIVERRDDTLNESIDDELATELWQDIRHSNQPSSVPLESESIINVPGFGLVRNAKPEIWSDLPSALQPTGDFEADSTRYWPVESSDWDEEIDNEEDEAEEDDVKTQSGDLLWKEEMEPIEQWAPPVLQPFDGDQDKLVQENVDRKKFNEQRQKPQKNKDGKTIKAQKQSTPQEFASLRDVPYLTNEQPYWNRLVPEPDLHRPETMYINDYEPGLLLDHHFTLGVAPLPYGKAGKALAAEVANKLDDGLHLSPWIDEKTGMFDALGEPDDNEKKKLSMKARVGKRQNFLMAGENPSSSLPDEGHKRATKDVSELVLDNGVPEEIVSQSDKSMQDLRPDAAHANLLRLLNKDTTSHPALRKQRDVNLSEFIKETLSKGSSNFIREHWSNAQRKVYAKLQEPNARPSDAYWPLEGNYDGEDDPRWKKHWEARQKTEDWMKKLDDGTTIDYEKDKLWRKYDNVWGMGPQAHILAEYGAYDDHYWKKLSEELQLKKEKLNFLADKASETAWQIQRHGQTPAMVKRLARLEKEFDRREGDIEMIKKDVWKRLTADLPHGKPSEVLENLDDQERWDNAAIQLGYKKGEVSMDPQWGPGQAEAFDAFVGMMTRQRAEIGLGGSYNNPSYTHTDELKGGKVFTGNTARLTFQNSGLDRDQKRQLIEVMSDLEQNIIQPVIEEEIQKADPDNWVEFALPSNIDNSEEGVEAEGHLNMSEHNERDTPQEDYTTWKTQQFGEESNSREK